MNTREVLRGEIYYLNCNESNGSVQSGIRPVIVIQNNVGNTFSGTTIVIPLTSKKKKSIPTHIKIKKDKFNKLPQNSTALCEQILTVNQNDLFNRIGYIKDQTMEEINKCLMISIGLAEKNKKENSHE